MAYKAPNNLVDQYNAGQRHADPSKIDQNFDYVTGVLDDMGTSIADVPSTVHTEMNLRGLWSASVQLTSPVSWADKRTSGNYYVPANSGNTGGPTTDAYHLQVMPMDANNVAQIAWPSYVGGTPMYRTEVGGIWQDWKNLVNATPTPTANAVPQADADGRLDRWCFHVGEFYYFRHPTMKPGFAPLQGGLISGVYQGKNITEYPIWAYLKTSEGQLLLKTEAQWQEMTTATWATLADGSKVGWGGIGGAPFYVQDLGAGTLRMPDLRGMYAEAAGFDSLGVGEGRGDQGRRITGESTNIFIVGNVIKSKGAMYTPELWGNLGTVANNTDRIGAIYFDSQRVVPTGPVNAPRRWGSLACAYLGTPSS